MQIIMLNLHFTISKNHQDKFDEELNHILEDIENQTGHTFDMSFSYQKIATDTVALTSNNEIYREKDGTILFRPSGHGALLENLNDLEQDIIFIKNIDNLVVQNQLEDTCKYKKMLAGILLETQDQIFKYLRDLIEAGNL